MGSLGSRFVAGPPVGVWPAEDLELAFESFELCLGQVALCQEGDLTACDFVYRVSPRNSESEKIGFTCGGRIAIGALPDCRTRLG